MSAHKPTIIAAVALILMAVLAPIAHFGTMETVRSNPVHSPELTISIGMFLVVIILDLKVALALYRVFRPISRRGSAIAAGLRIAYAIIFLGAVTRLFSPNVAHFDGLWDVGLVIFGFHLIVLGLLGLKPINAPALRWVGVLLVVAGVGYIFDSVVALVGFEVGFDVSAVAFIGEVALIVWLLWSAFNQKLRRK